MAALLLAGCAEAPRAPAAKPAEIPAFPPPPEQARLVWERSIHSSADVVKEMRMLISSAEESRLG